MIKALLLIFDSAATWDRIVAARRTWMFILLTHVLPLLLLVSVVEGWGLTRWERPVGEVLRPITLSVPRAVVYESLQLLLSLAAVFVGARLIRALGETFHGRHTFTQGFTVAAYGLSPVFLMRLFDAHPGLSPWLTWGIGIVLTTSILYHGIPRVMLPDPPHAFGLYLTSALLLTIITGIVRFLTLWYLAGKFTRLDELLSRFLPQLQS